MSEVVEKGVKVYPLLEVPFAVLVAEVAPQAGEVTLSWDANVKRLLEAMKAYEVKTDEEYKTLDAWRKRNLLTQKIVTKYFEPDRVEKKAAYDAVLEERDSMLKPLQEAHATAGTKLDAYNNERERLRRAEVQRLESEARKKAEDERLKKAEALSAKGKTEEAVNLLDKQLHVSISTSHMPAALGKTAEHWDVEVTDLSAFLAAAALRVDLQLLIEIRMGDLQRMAQEKKDKFDVPGVKATLNFKARS
jgi:hypothetical protein